MFQPMFVPPRHHAGLYWFASTFVSRLGRLFGNVHALELAPDDAERLRTGGRGRALLCPNHPTETDPIVVFWAGRRVGHTYNFLATRETLEGPRGWLLNRIGCYSVIRGYPDRESLRHTRYLLAQQDRKVVIFPEGLVYEHNDHLLEFQAGVAQLGFWALDDLEKAGKEPTLPMIPLAIRYRCLRDPGPYIRAGLAAVERRLNVTPPPGRTDYDRLRHLGGLAVARVEAAEGLPADDSLDLTARLRRARGAVLQRVAGRIGVTLRDDMAEGERLHHLTNELKAWVGVPEEGWSAYDEQLHRQRAEQARPLFAELMRLHNTVAVTGDYVAANPTPERFLEVLGRLQKEVLGRVPHQCPLGAVVRVAPAIPLEAHREEYRAAKRQAVAAVTTRLREAIQGMLQE